MGKRSRKQVRRSGGGGGGLSLQEQLMALANNNPDNEFAQSLKSTAEESARRREAEARRRELLNKTQRLLVLPHARGLGSFTNPLESGFVNPYTFFALEDVGPQRGLVHGPGFGKGISGKLTCSLEVQEWSPLFMPNTSGVFELDLGGGPGEDKKHRSYDFFSYDDLSEAARSSTTLPDKAPANPVIPGSELRGMARSVYEQLTNACLPKIDERNNPIKRTNLPKHPYRMEWDDAEGAWKLYETEVYRLGAPHHNDRYIYIDSRGRRIVGNRATNDLQREYANASLGKDRQTVWLDPSSMRRRSQGRIFAGLIQAKATDGFTECYLHVTGPMFKKHLTIYPVANASKGHELCSIHEGDDVFERFMRVVDAYGEKTTSKNHNEAAEGYRAYKKLLDNHETVLVYADDGMAPKYLAPSSLSPESYDTKILDLLGDHAPCESMSLCPACRLFGMVGKNVQLGSRVRFTDGMPVEGAAFEFCKPTTLAPLSTPRPSATEFYLKQPDGLDGMWNYDYLLQGRKRAGEKYLAKYPKSYRDLPDAGIQGRKVYLHARFDLRRRYAQECFGEDGQFIKSTQNVTVRPLKAGTFTFDVHFRDLSQEELANLAYALGGMGEGRLQKLGRGRPLGMGSVLVKVVSCSTKSYEYDESAGVRPCAGALDAAWLERHLPDDESSKARRKLITFLAKDLNGVEYARGKSLSDLVSYPKPHEGPLGERNQTFDWFKDNRGSVLEPRISNVLRTLSVEDVMRDPVWGQLPC